VGNSFSSSVRSFFLGGAMMVVSALAGDVALAAAFPAPARLTARDIADRFGASGVISISLSPDGTRLAVVTPTDNGENVGVFQLDGSGKVNIFAGSKGGDDSDAQL
jgi:hypothetical protein